MIDQTSSFLYAVVGGNISLISLWENRHIATDLDRIVAGLCTLCLLFHYFDRVSVSASYSKAVSPASISVLFFADLSVILVPEAVGTPI